MSALDLQTRLAEAHRLIAQGDLEGASTLLDAVLRTSPGEPNTLHMLAAVKQRRGDQAGALRLFDEATRRAPAAAPFHFNRANLLLEMGRNADALDGYATALKLRPQHAGSWRNRARALRELGRADEALASCEEALRFAPDDAAARYERALILSSLHRFAEGADEFAFVTRAQPGDADAHFNYARMLQELDRLDEALAAYDRAAALGSANADIQHNRAVLLYWLGRRDDAMAAFDTSLGQRPAHVETLYSKGVAHLAFGEFAEGWPLHGLRREPGSPISIEDLARGEPEWRGERVGVLRLWREQGVGDEVLFARLALLASAHAERVVLECGERLVPLLTRSFPELQVCAVGQAPAADAQCPIGSVGRFVAPHVGALSDGAAYLRADEERRAALRVRYEERADGRPIVGIAWASTNARLGRHKSAALCEWGALLARDCLFVSLQYGDTAAEIAAAVARIGAAIFDDPDVDQMASLDDFAAQIAAMDAIVSISNTTVHVAGALGTPCIALLPPAQGLLWYWGVTGEATPWYRSVRLVRRALEESWAEQVARAASMLSDGERGTR